MNSVLFVDDEKLITNSLRRGLVDEKYRKFFANSGEDALKVLERESISVLVTDMKMPGMNGLELLKIVKEKYPDIIRIVLSGYTQLPQVLVTVNQGEIFKFVTKPWDLENEFKFIIREAIDYFNFKDEQRKAKEALETKNTTFVNMLRRYGDVIKEVKDEVEKVIAINTQVFNEINQRVMNWDRKKKAPEALIEILHMYEDFVISILEVIPTTAKRFDIRGLIETLKIYIRDQEFLTHYDFGIDEKAIKSCRGKYDFILNILKNIVSLLFVNAVGKQVSLVVSSEEINTDKVKVTFIFEAAIDTYKSMEEIENLIGLMKLLVDSVHGKLMARHIKDHMVILFSVEVMK